MEYRVKRNNILKGVGYEIGMYRKEEAIQKAITEEWPLAMDDSLSKGWMKDVLR